MEKISTYIKQGLFTAFIAAMLIPMCQQIWSFSTVKALGGEIERPTDVKFTWNHWWTGEYQSKKEDYLRANFGFQPNLVRFNNEIRFSLFNKISGPNIYLGREGYLFRFAEKDHTFYSEFKGLKYFKEKVAKLESITKTFEENGVTLIFAITPGKNAYCRDYLPECNRAGMYSDSNNYKSLRHVLKSSSANSIDLNLYFERHREKLDYPLYAKGGIHWSVIGSFEGMREIMNYGGKIRGEKVPNITWTKPIVQTNKIDVDMIDVLNLNRGWPDLKMKYSTLIPDSNAVKPNVLVVSDSYFNAPYWSGIGQYFSEDFSYWYYNVTDKTLNSKPIDKKNFVNLTKDRDYIIIMTTLLNLTDFSWGFIEEAYYSDYPEKK